MSIAILIPYILDNAVYVIAQHKVVLQLVNKLMKAAKCTNAFLQSQLNKQDGYQFWKCNKGIFIYFSYIFVILSNLATL